MGVQATGDGGGVVGAPTGGVVGPPTGVVSSGVGTGVALDSGCGDTGFGVGGCVGRCVTVGCVGSGTAPLVVGAGTIGKGEGLLPWDLDGRAGVSVTRGRGTVALSVG